MTFEVGKLSEFNDVVRFLVENFNSKKTLRFMIHLVNPLKMATNDSYVAYAVIFTLKVYKLYKCTLISVRVNNSQFF